MSVTEDNLAVVNTIYDHFFKGEFDAFFESFADDIVLLEADSLPYGGTYTGKSNVTTAVRAVMAEWDKMTLDIHVVTAADDYVIAYGQFAATGLKTGIRATFPLAEVWKLRDGKVVFLNPVYGDTAQVVEALGG